MDPSIHTVSARHRMFVLFYVILLRMTSTLERTYKTRQSGTKPSHF